MVALRSQEPLTRVRHFPGRLAGPKPPLTRATPCRLLGHRDQIGSRGYSLARDEDGARVEARQDASPTGQAWRLPTCVAGTVSGFAWRGVDPVIVVPE
jgi:hypothetical protein